MRAARLVPFLLIALVAAGCSSPAGTVADDDDEPDVDGVPPSPGPQDAPPVGLFAAPVLTFLKAAPGADVTYPVLLESAALSAATFTVTLSGAGTHGEAQARLMPGESRLVFVQLRVPDSAAPGEYPLTIAARDATGRETATEDMATLAVVEAGETFARGDSAQILFTGRIASTGEVFSSNDVDLAEFPFTRMPFFRPLSEPLLVNAPGAADVVDGLYEGLIGMQEGESRTVTIPPERAYGPLMQETRLTREERLERTVEIELVVQQVGRVTFERFLETSGQQREAGYVAGDHFQHAEAPNLWRYRILEITSDSVEYQLVVETGEAYTIFDFWPNASVVERVENGTAHLVTTPPIGPGEAFTMRDHWPDMTRLVSFDETTIVVDHAPPLDLSYETLDETGALRTYTVSSVDERDIVATSLSPHPLAGETLVFDVLMLALTKG